MLYSMALYVDLIITGLKLLLNLGTFDESEVTFLSLSDGGFRELTICFILSNGIKSNVQRLIIQSNLMSFLFWLSLAVLCRSSGLCAVD